jgi:peptide chain release factor 1
VRIFAVAFLIAVFSGASLQPSMKTSMQNKLDQLTTRLAELNDLMSREDVTADMDQYRKITRENAEIGPVVEQYALWRQASNDETTAMELLADPSMRDFAEEEIGEARERMLAIERDLQAMLLPKDPNDDRNIFIEIRAGTGGDESALFAGDLLRMYLRYAERNRWTVEMMSESVSDLGGYKEVIVRIAGLNVYSKLKFESGGHRVQRVPATETQGRIHTSACTVAVMPEADEIGEVVINPAELAYRYLPRFRRRRPAHQQNRFSRARHAPADGNRGGVPGRPLAAQEQGSRDEGARRADHGQAAASSTRRKRPRARA